MIATVLFAALTGMSAQGSGDALLRQVEATTRKLKGFSCDLTASRVYTSAKAGAPPFRSTENLHVTFARPNLFTIDSGEGERRYRTVSDGSALYGIGKDSYTKGDIDPKARDFHWYHDDLLLLMVTGSFANAVEAPRPPTVIRLPSETWQGKPYKVLQAKVGGGYPITYKLYVGPDLLVHRIVHQEANEGRPLVIDSSAPTIIPNPPKRAQAFAFTPPPGLKRNDGTFPLQPGEFPPIQPGANATDFTLPTPSGGKLTLADAMKSSRAVLLNFWFVHCPPCRAEHPHLQKFYQEMKPKGLAVIAVDDQDPAALSAKYLKGAGLTFPVVLTGPRFHINPVTGETDYQGPMMPDYASLAPYGVRECPTNILIDAQTGKVVYRAIAWDEPGLRAALAKLGVG